MKRSHGARGAKLESGFGQMARKLAVATAVPALVTNVAPRNRPTSTGTVRAHWPTPFWTSKDPAAAMRPLSIWIWQPIVPLSPGAWMLMNTHEGSPR